MTDDEIYAIKRPDRSLMVYYTLTSFLLGPLFFLPLLPLYFRFHTLRYSFDREGISMSWGILFHREITLTYSRIQDIHLTSNLVERWLGLARIQVQTASSSSGAEMTIEGLHHFAAVRDFLYGRMRGAHPASHTTAQPAVPSEGGDLASILLQVAEEMRRIRTSLPGSTNRAE